MNKAAFTVPGREYRIYPPPRRRADGEAGSLKIVVLASDKKGLSIRHADSGREGALHFDSIQEFREPDFLFVKGQLWIEKGSLSFEPWFDERQIDSVARAQGLGVYRLPVSITKTSSPESDQIMELISGVRSEGSIAELKKMLFVVRDKENELQILAALATWLRPPDTPGNGVAYATRGISLARELQHKSVEAILRSYRAIFLTQQFMDEDLQGVYKIKASNMFGIPVITEDEHQRLIVRLEEIWKQVEDDLKLSLSSIKETKDVNAVGLVLINRIVAFGQRAIHNKQVGAPWESFRDQLMKTFYIARDLLRDTKRELLLGYIFHNMGNQLRFLDGLGEAEGMAAQAQTIAKQFGDEGLLVSSSALIERLKEMRSGAA